MLTRILLAVALLLAPAPAFAWWEYGHYSVARIAWLAAKPETRAAARRLLAQEVRLETPECAAGTIEDASYWPDCIRRYRDRFSYTFPWHYQNVDVCKPFDQDSACKDGNCVSAQIDRNAKLLADKALPVRERLQALAYLAHFVGDLHMPLHAGDRSDRGGNDFAVNYGIISGRTNLHSAWDGFIAERGISDPPGGADAILKALGMDERAAMAAGTTEDWARQGWEASRTFAYGTVMTDPCGPKPEARPTIDETTVRELVPIVRQQIARGGLRLARLMDEALG